MIRSGLVGFTLHGSLSHYYYQFCEVIIVWFIFLSAVVYFCASCFPCLFNCLHKHSSVPFQELVPSQDWRVIPAKVIFDQTVWAAVWNSIYYTVLGFLRLESPASIFSALKATFWPMLTVRQILSLLCLFFHSSMCI